MTRTRLCGYVRNLFGFKSIIFKHFQCHRRINIQPLKDMILPNKLLKRSRNLPKITLKVRTKNLSFKSLKSCSQFITDLRRNPIIQTQLNIINKTPTSYYIKIIVFLGFHIIIIYRISMRIYYYHLQVENYEEKLKFHPEMSLPQQLLKENCSFSKMFC